MRFKLSFLGLATLLLVVAGTAAARPAPERVAQPTFARVGGHKAPALEARSLQRSLHVSPSVLRRVARLAPALARQTLRNRIGPLGDVVRPQSHQLNYPGDLGCNPAAAAIWPVDAGGHTVTLTWSFFFIATQADFSDASQEPSLWFLAQLGSDYYYLEIDGSSPPDGPWAWDEAGIQVSGPGLAGRYVAGVNIAFYLDGSAITGVDAFLLNAWGPNALAPPFTGPFCLV